MKRFSKVISLGPSCETAYQLRQIVEQEEAYVFDWVIAQAGSVARAIATDFSEIVRARNLSLSGNPSHPFVVDALTHIEFHHDFRNDDTFLETLPDVQQKYDYLIARTRKLLRSDAAILFIHQNGTRDDARHLEAVIADRYPALDFELLELVCGGDPRIEREGRLVFASIPGYGSNWQERTPQWSLVFDDLLGDSYGASLTRRDPATRDPVPAAA